MRVDEQRAVVEALLDLRGRRQVLAHRPAGDEIVGKDLRHPVPVAAAHDVEQLGARRVAGQDAQGHLERRVARLAPAGQIRPQAGPRSTPHKCRTSLSCIAFSPKSEQINRQESINHEEHEEQATR